ncbi:MAG: helix-turn-helix domain-containing protein [Puniceicoccales bacterium]|jgi:hypothetical protein|nr:helix-turn-helix domain-containing protein [Puniceicoccales bacterium]
METLITPHNLDTNAPAIALADINDLRFSGIFPQGREPSIRTLRDWTRQRFIPHHWLGHFVYYNLDEVAQHIANKLKVPARF